MTSLMALACLAASAARIHPAPVSAEAIMAEAGLHQDCALAARSAFLYRQKLLMRMHRGNGRLAREERREYDIAPTSGSFEKHLTSFHGVYTAGPEQIPYDKPGFQFKGTDIDGPILDSLANGLTGDSQSRDGFGRDMFPLTTAEQRGYRFTIKDTEVYQGRKMYRISFEPRRPHPGDDSDPPAWKGEALIDAEKYQPVMVETSLATKIPFLVKTLLGTNIQGLGFSVSYREFAPGVWFPVSYGGEFRVKVVFVYTRNISINLENSGFRRTHVDSSIQYANAPDNSPSQFKSQHE